jgi:hypothetical protein
VVCVTLAMNDRQDALTCALRATLREKLRADLAERDKLRAVRVARELGATQQALAQVLGVTQPAVIKMLGRQPVMAPLIPAGRSGATPYEVAERYAAGLIDRDAMRAELGSWDYTPRHLPAGLADDVGVEDEGSFDGVLRAGRRGLIDDEDYEVIADVYEARARAGQIPGAVHDADPGAV